MGTWSIHLKFYLKSAWPWSEAASDVTWGDSPKPRSRSVGLLREADGLPWWIYTTSQPWELWLYDYMISIYYRYYPPVVAIANVVEILYLCQRFIRRTPCFLPAICDLDSFCGWWKGLMFQQGLYWIWVVVSNIFWFHPHLGKVPILTNSFQRGRNHQLVNILTVFNHTFLSTQGWPIVH